jgi:hypothetical protein
MYRPLFLLIETALAYDNFEPYKYIVSFGSITQDLDGEGFYDDLARGDSIVIGFGIRSIAGCTDVIRSIKGVISASAADLCGNPNPTNYRNIDIKTSR